MKQIIDRILDGKFDYEKGSLDFSVNRIELSLTAGEYYAGSFEILSRPGQFTEGHIYSRDVRMSLETDTFSGTKEEIGYTFSTVGLEEGDVVKGEIYVISNQGEYYLPYVVSVVPCALDSSLGNIRNLFHFANLAKTSWNEAVKLFYSPNFVKLFVGNDRQYYKDYLGLSRYFGNEQNVEEFLLQINKKHTVDYIPEKDMITISNPADEYSECIRISRNGWGYTALSVETDNYFLKLPKNCVTDDDFLGNNLEFPVIVDTANLHNGINYGEVRFFNAFTSVSVVFKVIVDPTNLSPRSVNNEFRHGMIDLVTYYRAFRMHNISADTWIAESMQLIDRMLVIDQSSVASWLFKAQLLIAEERYNEAQWILDRMETKISETEDYESVEWAYFLYLTTLNRREEKYINEITAEVERIYDNDTSKWQVAWLLLYLSEEYAKSPTKKWVFVENILGSGCVSPVIYVEAINLLITNPAMLTKLDPVEQRVIRYAARFNLLNDELKQQFVYLVNSKKVFNRGIYEVLVKLYDENPSDEILTTICTALLNANCRDHEFNIWYLRGIERDVHVTRLYEYYMYSADLVHEPKIPKVVYLYFSFHNSLSWEYKAFIYSHIIAMRNDEPELFISYKDEIDRFALDRILEGRINKDLAAIYRFTIQENLLTPEIAARLVRLVFTHHITVESKDMARVVVYQCRENVEMVYPIINGEAYLPIYTPDFTIMFEDNFSNRYMKSVEFELEKLMVPGKLASMLIPFVKDNLEFSVYVCECSNEMVEINDFNRDRYQMILDAPEIDEDYKTLMRTKLMQFYYDNDRIRELDHVLNSLTPENMTRRERKGSIRFLVTRGLYDRALDWVVRFGVEEIELRDLVNLTSRLIDRGDMEDSQDLLKVAAYVFFKGKYDENILNFLAANYHGMTKDIREIFRSCENFETDTRKLCENTLIQMLYTGYFVSDRIDIYRKYAAYGGNSRVRLSFLTQCAFDYFVREQLMEGYIFEELSEFADNEEELQLVCKLAYVKYYAEHKGDIDSRIRNLIHIFMNEFMKSGIYMTFFKEFLEEGMEEVNRFSDKTIIEYKTDPGRKVMIHYIIERDSQTKGEYITREMKDMYGGVHAKSFVLFFGENLLYYITEEVDGEEQLTESGSISKSDIAREITESRFSEINDIVISKTLQDYDTAQNLIMEYTRKEFVVNKLFGLQ